MSDIWKFVILIVSSYFIGNVTFARLFAFTRNKDDITTHGSGNPGTMNVLRTHGLWLAVATLIFDALKAVICCVWGYLWLSPTSGYMANLAVYFAGFSCIIGHCFPILYKFKGGKGVATGFGLACVARPVLIPVIIAVFLFVFLVWKIGSLASLITILVFFIIESIILLNLGYYASFIFLLVVVSIIFYAHRTNIKKIFDNKESKIDLNEAVEKDKKFAKEQKEKRELFKKLKFRKKNKQSEQSELVPEQSESTENVEENNVGQIEVKMEDSNTDNNEN